MAQYEEELAYDPFEGKMMLGFSPQYLLMQGVRFQLDLPSRRNHLRYFTLAPYLYAGYTRQYEDTRRTPPGDIEQPDNAGRDQVNGLGLEVMGKHFLRRENERDAPVYISYGLGYHYIELAFQEFGTVAFQEDDLTLYRFAYSEQQESIHRIDVILLIGATTLSDDEVLFADFFIGPVLKNSFVSSTLSESRDHQALLRYGFNGITLRAGFSLGILLR